MAIKRRALAERRKAVGHSQETLAYLLGVERSTVVRWEAGATEPLPWLRPKLARALAVSIDELHQLLTVKVQVKKKPLVDALTSEAAHERAEATSTSNKPGRLDDVKRREVLRMISMAGSLLAMPPADGPGGRHDWERLAYVSEYPSRLDSASLDEYARVNAQLWRVFSSSKVKSHIFPLVQRQLAVLNNALQQAHGSAVHRCLCSLAGDLFQLSGEIFFDGSYYVEAAHCYAMAASASKEANAFDLWACAITRHAFIDVYERQFTKSLPLLDLASRLACRGDSSLSTRYWVAAVEAQALAGVGEVDACRRALEAAEQVERLSGRVHTSGWLRFEGARLPEERGACYVELRRPELAETALTEALNLDLSMRRRGSVLTDMATVGVQHRDSDQLVLYADAALDTARQTGSGVVIRKLQTLQAQLVPFLGDSHVRYLDEQISAFSAACVN